MLNPTTDPDTIRHCPTCGALAQVGEPCLACALVQALLDAPEPEPRTGQPVFDPTALPCPFGQYEVRKEIAIGGMGVVYEAFDTRLGRTVALKLMRTLLLSTPEEKARFRGEAGAVAQLDHPHIVPIYEVGEQGAQPYFTMKLINGISLATRLKEGPLAPREAATLMAEVARAVDHAHQRGVLHRDLKPGNILLDESGQPWLTDFGLAKQTSSGSDLTRTGAALGTPEYMSPEQAGGRVREISAASDVWALGAVLYQMLTGQVPFRGDSHSEMFRRIAEEEAGSWVDTVKHPKAPEVPLDLSTVIQRCLQKDPVRRPPSALYLAEELERWLTGQAILSRPVKRTEQVVRWLRRHLWPVTAMVAAAVALLAVAFSLTRPDPISPPATNVRLLSQNNTLTRVSVQIVGTDGWLYATAERGGRFGFGGILRMRLENPEEVQILAYFSGDQVESGGIVGQGAPDIILCDYGLYGTTRGGGRGDGGTIFQITDGGSVRTVHEFGETAEGQHPYPLQLHSDGWLWGGLARGGVANKGGVFRFHPQSKAYELVFSCSGPDDPVKSGWGCLALAEIEPGHRVFAVGGGEIGAQRSLFILGPDSPPKVLQSYPVLDSPGDPGFIRGFTQGDDGAIYFPTEKGGDHNLGTIQRLTADGSPPTIVHHFSGVDGRTPFTRLLPVPGGRLCGATLSGGAYGQGTVFAFSPPSKELPNGEMSLLSSLHHGSGEQIALASSSERSLYGSFLEREGGSRIFRCESIRPGPFQDVLRFSGPQVSVVAGLPARPGRLAFGPHGYFYGLCSEGGEAGHGTLFRWKDGGEPETLLQFTGAEGEAIGSRPIGELTLGSDHALYGRTERVGSGRNLGTIFRFDLTTHQHTLLASMEGLADSSCGMVAGADGVLYGSAALGGVTGCGSLFKVIPPRDGRRGLVETVAEFTGTGGTLPGNGPGALTSTTAGDITYVGVTHRGTAYSITPAGAIRSLGSLGLKSDSPSSSCLLALHPDGWLYGIPLNGKFFTLFRFHPETLATEMIPSPSGRGWGYWGWCGLVNDGRGGFLTVSANLGSAGLGGILRLQPDGQFETVAEFSGKNGALPGQGPTHDLLPVGTDFYGTCPAGGTNGRGVIFKLSAGGEAKTVAEF